MSQDNLPFKDHFSDASDAYARHRPSYPAELFDDLRALAPGAETVWDCATGSGQAAVELAERFPRVTATDASAEQIRHARAHPRVAYRVAPAEASGIARGSVGLVTVAQALHWFAFDAFFAEAERVLIPGGIVAAWCYGLHTVSPAVDEITRRYYTETVGPCWPPERRHVESAYETVPCPLDPIGTRRYETALPWGAEETIAYIRTWSATKRAAAAFGSDPARETARELREAWPSGNHTPVRWPVTVRLWKTGAGKKP